MKFQCNSGLVLIAITALSLAAHPRPAAADSIGINFVGSGSSVSGAAGIIPQDNWNNESGNAGTSGDLADSTGAMLAGTAVTWSAGGTFSTTNAGGENGNLMSGYLDGDGITVTLSNIPYASYDVYVYANSDDGYSERPAEYTLNGVKQNNTTGSGATPFSGAFVTDPTGTGTTTGNYLEFTGVSGATLNLTTGVTIAPGSPDSLNWRTPIAGVQIVQVAAAPEPSPIAAIGLGALGLGGLMVFTRRRRAECSA